jgi:transcription-repair coupling factor (superfamily II helicase)
MLAAWAAQASPRVHLYVTAHLEEADDARDDIELFLGRACELFPAWETLPGEGAGADEIQAERLRVCSLLHSDEKRVIVTPIQALMQPVPEAETLRRNTIRLSVPADADPGSRRRQRRAEGDRRSPDDLVVWALDRGFSRLDMVESPGDVARRGDIVDLFVPGERNPYRIAFDGERIESIRRFDIGSQRSVETLESIAVTAVPERFAMDGEATTDFVTYLPSGALIILDDPPAIHELGRILENRLGGSGPILSAEETLSRAGRFPQLHLSRFGTAAISGEDHFRFDVTSVSRFEGSAADVVAELCRVSADRQVHVLCDNDGERQRLLEMVAEQRGKGVAAGDISVSIGMLHRGFEWTRTKTVVVGHHELFHRQRPRRRIRRLYAGQPLESWLELKPGDLVVHVVHGIAVYRGLAKLRKGTSGQQEEFLTLEFDEEATIHVPCSQIDLVQKYIGAGGRRPALSKLGGKRWSKTKEKVAQAVSELADSLLRLQALRLQASGTSYPGDTQWQREFDAAFPYEETEDQLQVAGEIREDLMRPRPMDRIVCGDVGYGKTELAMRAAFKVIEYGRQVAVLVPTTVLAEQHYESFRERMAEYPFSIHCLSRFRTEAEQRRILEDLKKGRLDIVVGTHRLISRDVAFANLGLVIIDEEQRFGVEHKERLKAMRETVDVLTLTATPIPRTLHMGLVGLRDISSLQTPPVDRRAIATEVRPFDRALIRDAILREMNRDGQVFFVHNFVQSIAAMAETVRSVVPEARIVFAHGQMKDDDLEEVMHRFVRREADVLVSTTIIESGIDIPSANTIFINRADRFGLADLHQLRGRVGRSSHRAYCYLLLSPDRPPTSKAAKRLKTIEEFSELGAGFRIAMRDLEIRGAGNLLGKEQSGHIAAVGYEMYCRLLEQSVRRLRNEPDPTPPPVHVDLDVAAHVPREYIQSDRLRIEAYRRMVSCRTPEDLSQLEQDIADAFGPPPEAVQRLLELAEIRIHARKFGIQSISLRPPDVIFMVNRLADAEPAFRGTPGTVRMPDERTIHLRLPPRYLKPGTLLPVLRRMMSRPS